MLASVTFGRGVGPSPLCGPKLGCSVRGNDHGTALVPAARRMVLVESTKDSTHRWMKEGLRSVLTWQSVRPPCWRHCNAVQRNKRRRDGPWDKARSPRSTRVSGAV
jgi:hypothetical protein